MEGLPAAALTRRSDRSDLERQENWFLGSGSSVPGNPQEGNIGVRHGSLLQADGSVCAWGANARRQGAESVTRRLACQGNGRAWDLRTGISNPIDCAFGPPQARGIKPPSTRSWS
jgi:hypothetical protein